MIFWFAVSVLLVLALIGLLGWIIWQLEFVDK